MERRGRPNTPFFSVAAARIECFRKHLPIKTRDMHSFVEGKGKLFFMCCHMFAVRFSRDTLFAFVLAVVDFGMIRI